MLPFFLLLFSQNIFCQGVAVGKWRIHASLDDIVAVADAGDKIFCASHAGLFSVDKIEHSFMVYSKATGMSDVGISTIAWHEPTKTLLVAYTNSNIDFITPSGVVNLNDIQQKSIIGDKTIYQIAFNGNNAYLACGFGVVNIDMAQRQFADTYIVGNNGISATITSIAISNNQIWAQTKSDLRYINLNNPLISDYQYWNQITLPKTSSYILSFNKKIFSKQGDSIMLLQNNQWQLAFYFQNKNINCVFANDKHLIIATKNKLTNDSLQLLVYDENLKMVQRKNILNGVSTAIMGLEDFANQSFWLVDIYNGMFLFSKNNQGEKLAPNANHYNTSYAFAEKNNTVWIAGGMTNNYQYTYVPNGFYSFSNEQWFTHDRYTNRALDSVYDLIATAISPDNSKVYFASFGWGLTEYTPETDKVVVYKNYNSILSIANGDPTKIRVSDLAFDSQGNLWMNNNVATQPIVVKKADGTWKKFSTPNNIISLQKIIVDKNDQKWMTTESSGIVVFNSGSDIDNTADDQYRVLGKGTGNGGLPSDKVHAMAEDKDGQIWVGTDAGVVVFYDAANIIQGGDAQQIIVSNPTDSIANYLFAAEVITDIKVDGANRKWVSSSHGVWLMSADGLKEIYHFTKDNSPLISNIVYAIGLNNTTGEVFFATDAGMCSFKSDATKGGDTNGDVLAFPNPVPHNYAGTIAIRGLVDNAYVKITDVNGQLIYSTKALGGQAVWNGKNLQGEKTASGVYLVFATNADGSETVVSKILYDK